MTTIASIPLNQLIPWDGNVRKTSGSDTALAELAASIAAHGLLNNLVVRRRGKETYAVVAGGRRLQALRSLAKANSIPEDYPVPCQVLTDETDATEISLAENAVREDMHPADEFEAFRTLADKGVPAIDIAARFGVSETVVLKRLRLARVSPVLMQAYRDDKTTLECLMAFAVTDDHKRQEKLWKTCPAWMRSDASAIRDALTEAEIDAGDRRVKFVTLKSYEKAGGTVRRDLFAEGEDGIFIDDAALLDRLFAEKLEAALETVRQEGWKWIEHLNANGYEARAKCRRMAGSDGPLSEKLEAEYEALTAEREKLSAKKKLSDAEDERLSDIDDRIWELDRVRPEVFAPEQKALSGAFVEIDRDGKLDIQCGFVRPEDARAIDAASKNTDAAKKQASKDGLSRSLAADLAAHRTAALAALLAGDPRTALAAIVHSIGARVLYNDPSSGALDFDIRTTSYPQGFREHGKARGIEELDKLRKQWKDKLPSRRSEFWQWCLVADDKTLLSMLAFFAALSCTGTDHLASPLALDMTVWFTPTAANFFSRIGKNEILKAVKDATGKPLSPAQERLKKSELAVAAERAVQNTGWLPKPLRPVSAPANKRARKAA